MNDVALNEVPLGFKGWQLIAPMRVLRFCWLVFLVAFAVRPAAATINYRVSLNHPDEHAFHVEIIIPNPAPGTLISLPAWNALYQIRDFAYRIHSVEVVPAPNGGPAYPFKKIDKQTWQIGDPGGISRGVLAPQVVVRYSIEWNDPGPFNTQFDVHHAFVNLAEILMYVPDRRNEGTSVTFVDLPYGWQVAMQMATGNVKNMFFAPSYDALVDAPVEAGKFEQFTFAESGAHFRVIVDSQEWNKSHLEQALQRITRYELQLMGGPPFESPDKEYTFFFHLATFAEVGGGGMEHSNSTAIAATSIEFAAAVAAHEFFHSWNVKRIRPRTLEPVDYTKEQYTRALWFAEGVTSTYAAYALERTGLWTKNQFYGDLVSQIVRLDSRPARRLQSVEESSLDAWFEKYDDYNRPERSISYYNKGQIIGVLLDLSIRDATDNRKSLDDVMRRMDVEYAQQNKFYDDSDGVRAVVEEVAGRSFEDFFSHYVSGTSDIPYGEFLGLAGLELKPASNNVGYSISEISHPSERQRRILDGLLRGTSD